MRAVWIWMVLAAAPSLARAQEAPKPAPPPAKTASHTVGEVVVSGQAAAVQVGIDRKSYSVAGDLQAQTGSIGDALRNLPSVTVDVSGNVALRGDANVTILIDGKPSSLFQGDNRGQALQQLPAERIERVEVITNPSAEFRAEGSAGIINLITKKAQGAGRTGSLRVSGGDGHRYSASGAVGFNGPKLSAVSDLNLRHDTQKQENSEDRANLDPAGGFDHTLQTQETHIDVDSASGRASADYDLDKATRLSGETHGNFTRFDLDGLSHYRLTDATGATTQVFDRGLAIIQHRANAEVSTGLRRNFTGDGHMLNLNLSYEATNDDRVRSGRTHPVAPAAPDSFDSQALDNLLQRVELKGDYTRPMGERATLKAGFDLQRDDNGYNNRGFRGPSTAALAPDPTLTNLFDYRQTLSQGYVTYERPFGEVTVLAGLRLEDTRLDLEQVTLGRADRQAYTRLYPSLHLAWKVSDQDKLTASFSHRIQRPNPDQFNSFRFLLDPLNFRAGNPELKPQETQSYEVGFERHEGATLLLATLFWRRNVNVVSDVIEPLGGGVFLNTQENAARSESGGLEVVASGRLTKALTYNLSADAYWNQIDPRSRGSAGKREGVSGFGRGVLNWQATAADLVQVNGFFNGERLTAQGHSAPLGGINLGYRRKLTDQVSFLLTAQTLIGTLRDVVDTPVLKNTLTRKIDANSVQAGLTWTFGGGRARDPGFDFRPAGASPQ